MRQSTFLLALFGMLFGKTLAQQEVLFDCSQMPSVCTNMCWGIYCAFGNHVPEALLTYDAPDDEAARERRISAGCNRCAGVPSDANSCDEYPFATTREADQVAQINRCVPQAENSRQGQRLQKLYSRLNAPEQFIIGFTRTDAAGVQFCNYDDACENDGTIYQEDDVAPNPPNNAAVRLKYRYLLESGVEYISHVKSPAGKMVKRLIAIEGNDTEIAEGDEDPEGWIWVEDYIYRQLAQEGDEEDPDWVVDYIYRRNAQGDETETDTGDVDGQESAEDPDWVLDYIYRQQENETDTEAIDVEEEGEDPDWVVDYIYRRNAQDEAEAGTGAETGVETGAVDGEAQGENPDWVVDYFYRRDAQTEVSDTQIAEEDDPGWVIDYIYQRNAQDDEGQTQTETVDGDEDQSKWQWVEKYFYRQNAQDEGKEIGAADGEGKGDDPDWAVDYIYRRG